MLNGPAWLLYILWRYAGESQGSWQRRSNSAVKGPSDQRDLCLSFGTKLLGGEKVDKGHGCQGVHVHSRVRFDARKVRPEQLGGINHELRKIGLACRWAMTRHWSAETFPWHAGCIRNDVVIMFKRLVIKLLRAWITHICRCSEARRSPSKLGYLSLNRAGELLFKCLWQHLFARFAASASWLAPRVAARLLGHVARSAVHTGAAIAAADIEETVNAVETPLDFDTKGNGTMYSTSTEGSGLNLWLVSLTGFILSQFRVPGFQPQQ